MAGLESLDTSLTQDLEDMQIKEFKILQTSKKKDSILYDGYYFNHMRDNKNTAHILLIKTKWCQNCQQISTILQICLNTTKRRAQSSDF
jgi:hypothetical protein